MSEVRVWFEATFLTYKGERYVRIADLAPVFERRADPAADAVHRWLLEASNNAEFGISKESRA